VAGRLEDVPALQESRRRRSSQKPVNALAFRLFGWIRRHEAPFGDPGGILGVRNAKAKICLGLGTRIARNKSVAKRRGGSPKSYRWFCV